MVKNVAGLDWLLYSVLIQSGERTIFETLTSSIEPVKKLSMVPWSAAPISRFAGNPSGEEEVVSVVPATPLTYTVRLVEDVNTPTTYCQAPLLMALEEPGKLAS